tara:strand:- start:265 stop:681 length:417 start_codon:yes stop_codon:yes gene_type:complete
MDPVETFQVNSAGDHPKLLIATQGSDFKDRVTQGIVDAYKSDSVFIKVVDVAALNNIDPKVYAAIVIIHTWEYERPPAVVTSFVNNNSSDKDKIITLTTSGSGTSKMEGIDAIAGESILDSAADYVDDITTKLNPLLK